MDHQRVSLAYTKRVKTNKALSFSGLNTFNLYKVAIIFLNQITTILPVELAVGTTAQVVEATGGKLGVALVELVGNV